uniref:SAM domain-containing protein n=1 Tax=Rhizophagus irregularis (strain DAOM 181602 / DAOM 197198 / MUCL 43194) TaxID=747089 RepID=U9SMZ7_RHIID
MSTSEINTSTATSVTATEEKNAPTLAEVVRKYKTKEIIDFLRKEEDLELVQEDYDIIEKERINGRAFLKIAEEKLRSYGMPGQILLTSLRNLASSLREVLIRYGLESEGTDKIPLFSLQTYEIKDSDKHFEHCMAEILVRLKNYGTLVVDSLEAMRNEYVVAILHTAINITRDSTGEELSMRPEYEVIGDESTGRVDFAIKKAENLICVTEDKPQRNVVERFAQNIVQLESSFQTNKRKRKRDYEDDFDYLYGSKLSFSIEFSEDALDKESVEYQALRNGVKKVLGIVVGLLKDRACAEDDPPSKKKARISFEKIGCILHRRHVSRAESRIFVFIFACINKKISWQISATARRPKNM